MQQPPLTPEPQANDAADVQHQQSLVSAMNPVTFGDHAQGEPVPYESGTIWDGEKTVPLDLDNLKPGELMILDEAPQPRVSENKSGILQHLIDKVVAGGGTDLGEGKVLVNLEGFKPGEVEVYAAMDRARQHRGTGAVLALKHRDPDAELPVASVSAGTTEYYIPPVVEGYTPPVFEVAGRYIEESGAIPVYGKEPVLVRKHPVENWSVHWSYQGRMSWVPFTRMPRVSMGMIELHLQDEALYPREAHEWARLCAYEPHRAQAQIPRPAPPKPTWTQRRKIAAGKQPGQGRRKA